MVMSTVEYIVVRGTRGEKRGRVRNCTGMCGNVPRGTVPEDSTAIF
jgi:hypothetical protein